MRIEALSRQPNTSQRHLRHRIYPYLLRSPTIDRANQVWAMGYHLSPDGPGLGLLDGCAGPVQPQDLLLKALPLETYFCLQAVDEAIARMKPLRFSIPIKGVS